MCSDSTGSQDSGREDEFQESDAKGFKVPSSMICVTVTAAALTADKLQ